MSGRESYGVNGGSEQSNLGFQSSMQNMSLAYTADRTTLYKPMAPPNSSSPLPTPTYGGGDGSAVAAAQLSMSPNIGEVVVKRKRGRPRKYAPDGTMTPALSSPPLAPASVEGSLSSGKKSRGRPPGSGRKQQAGFTPPPSGSTGVGFTPHVITVKAGEDVLAKLMSFSRHNTRAVCILSASGAISNVTLQQSATSGGTVTYEGRFEILSLSGSFMPTGFDGQRSRTGGLSISLSGPDGRVLGGGVSGLLTAGSVVQVIVGSFTTGQKQSKSRDADVLNTQAKLLTGPTIGGSPPSRATMSESDGGPGSPLNQGTGVFNNNNPQGFSNMSSWR